MKRYLLLLPLLLFLIPTQQTQAQDNIGEILRAGSNDANLLLQSYIKPYASGFGADLNTGWNTSARPYRMLGFDVRLSASLAFVPSSDLTFDVRDIESNFLEIERFSNNSITPTAAGESSSAGVILGKTYENPITGLEETLFEFEMPQGSGFEYAPAAMVQGTVGIIRDTDITLRFMPSIDIPNTDANINLFGIGAKHGINQWIPGGGLLPVDLAVQVGYTNFNFNLDTNVQPDEAADIYNPYNDPDNQEKFNPNQWDNQAVEMSSNGYTVNLIVGKHIPMLAVYGGVGFQSSTMTISSPGNFPLTVPNENRTAENPEPRAIDSIERPIDLSVDGENSIHALAGFRVRLGFIAITGSYTLSKYPVANVGVGLSFR